uniref:Uncharacterized protein n=1 Tax=Arundo donax TaxID=35708 RepID=A0A0A8ZNF2_ARUDO
MNLATYLIQRILWSLILSCHKNKHLQSSKISKNERPEAGQPS